MKRGILIGILSFSMLTSLLACNNQDDQIKSSSSPITPETNENIQEKIENASISTKNKLKESLTKDYLALNLELDSDLSIKYEDVETTINGDQSILEASSSITKLNFFTQTLANLDLNYYRNESQINTTDIYSLMIYNVSGEEERLELGIDGESVSTCKDGILVKEDINPNVHQYLASGIIELDRILNLSQQGLIEYFTSLIANLVPSTSINKEVIQMLIDFFNNKITSAELLGYYLAKDEELQLTIEQQNFVIAILDYIKTIDISSTFKYLKTEEGTYLIKFDYEAFKVLIDDTLEDLKKLSINLKEAEAKALVAGIDELKVQLSNNLPYNIILDIDVSLVNGLLKGLDFSFIVDGRFLLSENENVDSQTGKTVTFQSFLKNIMLDFSFDFEFGNVQYEIPILSA